MTGVRIKPPINWVEVDVGQKSLDVRAATVICLQAKRYPYRRNQPM